MRWLSVILLLAVAAGALIFGRTYVEGNRSQVAVVVAERDIPANTRVQANMLRQVLVPEESVRIGTVTDVASVTGTLSAVSIPKGAVLHQHEFISSESTDRPHLGLLCENCRGIAVKSDLTAAFAASLRMGDLVDVVWIPDRQKLADEPTRRILLGKKVLGIRTSSARDPETVSDDRYADHAPAAVMLEVTPEEAEQLAYAEANGSIKLIYTPRDAKPVETPGFGPVAPQPSSQSASPIDQPGSVIPIGGN